MGISEEEPISKLKLRKSDTVDSIDYVKLTSKSRLITNTEDTDSWMGDDYDN